MEEIKMRDAEKSKVEGLALGMTAAVYYVVMLAAFAIGRMDSFRCSGSRRALSGAMLRF